MATEPPPSRRRRVAIWSLRALVLLLLLYAVTRIGFQVWMQATPPEDAPRIAFSLDDTWLNSIGITDTTYQIVMTNAGGRLVPMNPGDFSIDEIGQQLEARRIEGVLLTGGGDVDPALYGGDPDSATMVNRERDDFEIALIHAARKRGLPILGICRGAQILNVALGGTLRNLRDDEELEPAHFNVTGHPVSIERDSLLADLIGTADLASVYTFHGQAVDAVPPELHAVATGPGDVIEAIESSDTNEWTIAVQWHPEMEPGNQVQQRLFAAFVAEARTR